MDCLHIGSSGQRMQRFSKLTGSYTRTALTQKLRRGIDEGNRYALAGINTAKIARRTSN
jgi:hypothetical protein